MRRLKSLAIAFAAVFAAGCGHVSAVQPIGATGGMVSAHSAGSLTSSYAGSPSLTTTAGGAQLSGAGALVGQVLDTNHQGVPGVTVVLQPGGVKLLTDASGSYHASGVPAGNYTFQAMATGLVQAMPVGMMVQANTQTSVPPILMVPGQGPSGVSSITFTEDSHFGQIGHDPGLLKAPVGLAVRSGDVLALDVNTSFLVNTGIVRQYNGGTGAFEGKFGDYSGFLGLSEMKSTVKAIAVDSNGNPLVLDSGKIWRFKPNGTKDTTFNLSDSNAVGIAVDPRGGIYTAGPGGVQRLDSTGQNATPVGGLGDCKAIAAAPDGLWVSTGGQIQKIGYDGTPGVAFGPSGGAAQDAFGDACGLAVDNRNGEVIVCDKGARNVYVYDAAGSLVGKIGQGVLETPVAAGVDPNGSVYVLDQGKKEIYKFSPTSAQ
ncbi:MAG TPA: carboxypeptidase regulatory-like domain-containing protein [Oscillatoriaceae cyanobacterium]